MCYFSIQLGMSSSQLTNIFQRDRIGIPPTNPTTRGFSASIFVFCHHSSGLQLVVDALIKDVRMVEALRILNTRESPAIVMVDSTSEEMVNRIESLERYIHMSHV